MLLSACTVNISGGTFTDGNGTSSRTNALNVGSDATVNISGGTFISNYFVYISGTANITGGDFSQATISPNGGTVNIKGATVRDIAFQLGNTGTLNIDGDFDLSGSIALWQKADGLLPDTKPTITVKANLSNAYKIVLGDAYVAYYKNSANPLVTYVGESVDADATDLSTTAGTIETGAQRNALCGVSTYQEKCLYLVDSYTVTFEVKESGFGSVDKTSLKVTYGTIFSTSGNVLTIGGQTVTATPSANTAQYTYAFANWSPASGTITADATITANFTRTTNTYTVTITVSPAGYGSVDKTSLTVTYGTTFSTSGNVLTIGGQTVTATPTESTAQYTYAFANWSPASGTITADATITANFTRTTNTYTVTIAVNDSTLGSVTPTSVENVPYGTVLTTSGNTVTINGTTVTASTKSVTGYTVTFSSWTNGTAKVEGNLTVTANFAKTAIEYTITYDLAGGTVATANPTKYTIETPTFTLNNPTKVGYTFTGWTGSNGSTPQTSVSVAKGSTGDKTFTANWSSGALTITYSYDSGCESNAMGFASVTRDADGKVWEVMLVKSASSVSLTPFEFGTYTITAYTTINHNISVSVQSITFSASATTFSVSITISHSGDYDLFYGSTAEQVVSVASEVSTASVLEQESDLESTLATSSAQLDLPQETTDLAQDVKSSEQAEIAQQSNGNNTVVARQMVINILCEDSQSNEQTTTTVCALPESQNGDKKSALVALFLANAKQVCVRAKN